MKPLKGEAKKYTSKGHKLESFFFEQLVNHAAEGLLSKEDLNLSRFHDCGMV